jgi:hypothetical protein
MLAHTIITPTIELCVMPESSLENAPPLDGVLHLYPFLGEPLPDAAASLYTEYAAEYGAGNVLVIKRFPTGIDELEAVFAEATDSVTQPDVTGLAAHSRRVLEEWEDTARVLAPAEQSLLLETFATQYEWETPYLQRASDHESFSSDIGGSWLRRRGKVAVSKPRTKPSRSSRNSLVGSTSGSLHTMC